jgi:hypothetical protein
MRQKTIPTPAGGSPPPSGGGDPAKLQNAKKNLSDLLKVGDAAIKKALSGNSQEFLAANRQMGGE